MNLIFIHVPKNAGTTIKHYLKNHNINTPRRHETFKLVLKQNEKIKDYFSFGVVRNPWGRHLSLFLHWQNSLKKWKQGVTFEDYVFNLRNLRIIMTDTTHIGLFLTPQLEFLDGVKHVLRFENLKEDFKIVQEYIGASVPLEKVPPFSNATEHNHYSEYYNDKTIKIVEEICQKDILYFNYSFYKKHQSIDF